MDIGKTGQRAVLALGLALGGSFAAGTAQAAVILTFGQIGNGNPVTAVRNGGATNIDATDAAVTVTQIIAGLPTPFSALLGLHLHSTTAATTVGGVIVTQNFSGNFCITSGTNCTGTNYLSGTLVDAAFGSGASLTLTASTPPATDVTFNSDVIALSDLQFEHGASFSFANVNPALSIVSNSINDFTSSVSGTFSANVGAVPEPANLAVLGMGLFGLGAIRRRLSGDQ